MNLEFIQNKHFRYLHKTDWTKSGFIHGFTGSDLDFRSKNLTKSEQTFKLELGAADLILPSQNHGNNILMVDLNLLKNQEAYRGKLLDILTQESFDAIYVKNTKASGNAKIAFGIRTADCVPIIINSDNEMAIIHAGWRGLANGIIKKTLMTFVNLKESEVLIGPCACGSDYEVGMEVPRQIGEASIYKEAVDGGKVLLDLSETTRNFFKIENQTALPAQSVNISTITDKNFHSYRRDGEQSGRNMAFVLL